MSGDEFTFEELSGIGPKRASHLRAAGYHTLHDLHRASIQDLADVSGLTQRLAEQIKDQLEEIPDERPGEPRTPPMDADDLVRLDNEPGELDREAVAELREHRLYLSTVEERDQPEFETRQTDWKNQWRVDIDADTIVGQIGKSGKRAEVPGPDAEFEHEFEPHLPEQDGVTYHPKFGANQIQERLRRRSGATVQPERVFPPDERQVFYPSGYPWRCIGKIYTWTDPSGGWTWTGSGALVGRNVVVTASHVVPWGSSPWMMKFVPATWDGASVIGSSVESYVQYYYGYKNHNQGDDMAVLKLYTPLGNTLGYFGARTYHDSWEGGHYWTKVGYPGAVASGARPSRIAWYPIVDDDSDGAGVELEYKADSSPGDSGGPVFGWWSGWPYVIGTHSGWEEEYHFPWYMVKNNLAAGGGALTNLVRWARNNW